VTDRLVDLQRDLVRVQHDGRHAARALVGAHERSRLFRDARRLARKIQPLDVLPAALAARADMRARITPHLEDTVAGSRALDARAGLDQFLFDLRPFRGKQELVLPLRAHHRLADEDLRAGHGFVRFEAQRHLLRERDLERVSPNRRTVRPGRRGDGSEVPRVLARRCPRKRAGSQRGIPRPSRRKPAVGRKAPGAVQEHAHPDALALGIRETLDAAALRRNELIPFQHNARVCVLGPGTGRRIHGRCTDVSHRAAL